LIHQKRGRRLKQHAPRAAGALCLATVLAAALAPPVTAQGFPVGGSIRVEYDQLGGFAAVGAAIGPETNDRQGGKFQDFVNNNHIYWNARVDPGRGRQIGGAIFDKWSTVDYENGPLGYPVSREFRANREARGNHFENGGEIYWTQQYGARIVWGEIGDTWKASGYENGQYGVPVSDEYDFEGGKRQDFEFKSIIWNPNGFASDVENENVLVNCDPDSCAKDDRVAVIGEHIFGSTGGFNRQAPTTDAIEDGELAAAAAADQDELVLCDESGAAPDSGATGDGSFACWDPNAASLTAEPQLPATPSDDPLTETPPPPAPSTPPDSTPNEPPPLIPQPAASSTPPSSQAPNCTAPAGTVPALPPTSSTSQTAVPLESEPCLAEESATTTAVTTPTAEPSTTNAPPKFAPFRSTSSGPMKATLTPRTDISCDTDNDSRWRGDRQYACMRRGGVVRLFDKPATDPSRTLIGEVVLYEQRESIPNWKSNRWTERYSVQVDAVNDNSPVSGGGTTRISANGGCFTLQGVCTSGGEATIATRTVSNGLDLNRTWNPTMNWTSGSRPTATATWQTRITFRNGTSVTAPTANSPTIRCDNDPFMRNYVGCTFREVRPVLNYSLKSNIGSFNAHVARAIASGLPGSPGQAPLKRIYPPVNDENRRAACGSVTGPREGGVSCDEYPFASTDEGARSSSPNSGPGRTFDGCGIQDTRITPLGSPVNQWNSTGYSVCLIPQAENSRAGSYLSWFFTQNRIVAGDTFWVKPS